MCADLCSPVEGWVIHLPGGYCVGFSGEPGHETHVISPTKIRSSTVSSEEENDSLFRSELTLKSIFFCKQPDSRRWLQLRAAPVRWQCQHTRCLNMEKWPLMKLLRFNRVQRDTADKVRWRGEERYYPAVCPLVQVSGRREMVSPSHGSGCLSILGHTWGQITANSTDVWQRCWDMTKGGVGVQWMSERPKWIPN